MNMRTLMVSVAAMTLGLTAAAAVAQPAPAEPGAEARRPMNRIGGGNVERVIEQLNLTEEQKKQVEPILADAREKVRAAMQESQQKLTDVLTPEQRTKFQELMREQRGANAATTQPMNPVDRLQSAVQALNLTDDQKAKLKEIFASYRTEFDAIRTESAGDRQAMAGKVRPLIEELRAKVTALLTPEQSDQLQKDFGAWREKGLGGGKDRASKLGTQGAGRQGLRNKDKTNNDIH